MAGLYSFLISWIEVKQCRYTEDGMLNIDNNAVENSIRPIAIGRKNYFLRAVKRQLKEALCATASSATANSMALNRMHG